MFVAITRQKSEWQFLLGNVLVLVWNSARIHDMIV